MNTEAAGHGDGDGGGSVVRGFVRLEERAGVVKGSVFVSSFVQQMLHRRCKAW